MHCPYHAHLDQELQAFTDGRAVAADQDAQAVEPSGVERVGLMPVLLGMAMKRAEEVRGAGFHIVRVIAGLGSSRACLMVPQRVSAVFISFRLPCREKCVVGGVAQRPVLAHVRLPVC